jgi:transposase-like protein
MDKSKAIEKEEFWRLAIREHLGSGLTARSFCQREGLSESLFYAWRKKIQQRDDISEVPQRAAADRLVPVKVVAKSSQIRQQAELPKQTHLPMDEFSMSRFEVLTPCGFTVRADDTIEPTRFGALLGAIVGLNRSTASC